jgi:hypothetical protein
MPLLACSETAFFRRTATPGIRFGLGGGGGEGSSPVNKAQVCIYYAVDAIMPMVQKFQGREVREKTKGKTGGDMK